MQINNLKCTPRQQRHKNSPLADTVHNYSEVNGGCGLKDVVIALSLLESKIGEAHEMVCVINLITTYTQTAPTQKRVRDIKRYSIKDKN
jgi:hypothetical protein